MISRTLAKRLQRLETRIPPADKRIYQILFISSEDGSVTNHIILGGDPSAAWSKYSRGSGVVSKQAAESLSTAYSSAVAFYFRRGEE